MTHQRNTHSKAVTSPHRASSPGAGASKRNTNAGQTAPSPLADSPIALGQRKPGSWMRLLLPVFPLVAICIILALIFGSEFSNNTNGSTKQYQVPSECKTQLPAINTEIGERFSKHKKLSFAEIPRNFENITVYELNTKMTQVEPDRYEGTPDGSLKLQYKIHQLVLFATIASQLFHLPQQEMQFQLEKTAAVMIEVYREKEKFSVAECTVNDGESIKLVKKLTFSDPAGKSKFEQNDGQRLLFNAVGKVLELYFTQVIDESPMDPHFFVCFQKSNKTRTIKPKNK